MKKVARYYLGEEGIGNFDADHIQVRRRLVDNTFLLKKIIPQEIVVDNTFLLKINTTGNCGHVLRRMVLGDNG